MLHQRKTEETIFLVHLGLWETVGGSLKGCVKIIP